MELYQYGMFHLKKMSIYLSKSLADCMQFVKNACHQCIFGRRLLAKFWCDVSVDLNTFGYSTQQRKHCGQLNYFNVPLKGEW